MKKLILISLLTLGSSLFAADIGVRVQTPIGNNSVLDIGFRSDDHRYDNRYKNFDYNRNGYRDDFGYFYGYFDKVGYFYNNIFFTYDSRYTYYDRLHHRGYFKHNHPHYREYRYHKNNDWNRTRKYREVNKPIYGAYYDKKIVQLNQSVKQENRNLKQQNQNIKQQNQNLKQNNQNLRQQNSNQNHNNDQKYKEQRYDKNNKEQFIEEKRNNR